MTARRYAEDTKVPAGQSQDQIKALLRKAGADSIAVYESAEQSAIAFRLQERLYKVTVPISKAAKNPGQDERRAWRLLLLLLKAKCEAINEGATTVEREFLADMLMPDGQTVGEWASPQLALAYKNGAMPTQLLIGGSK